MSMVTSKDSGYFSESGGIEGAQYLNNVAKRERTLKIAQANILGLANVPLDENLINPISFCDFQLPDGSVVQANRYSDVEVNLYEGRVFSHLLNRDSAFEVELTKGYQASQLWDDRPVKYSEEPKASDRIVEALLDPEDRSLVNPLQLETLSFPVDNEIVRQRFEAAYPYLYPRALLRSIDEDRSMNPPSMPCMTSTFMKAALAGNNIYRTHVGKGGCGVVCHIQVAGQDYAEKKWKDGISEDLIKQEMIANLYVAQDPTKPIVQVMAISSDSLVMEYIEGVKDFFTLFENGSWATDRQLVKASQAIVDGLKHLESQGFCHKDIKFENCMLTTSGDVKLMDFGFTQRIGVRPKRLEGTRLYMAPELFVGCENSIKTDVYALGVCIHQYQIGRPHIRDIIQAVWSSIVVGCVQLNPRDRLTLDAIKERLNIIEASLGEV